MKNRCEFREKESRGLKNKKKKERKEEGKGAIYVPVTMLTGAPKHVLNP